MASRSQRMFVGAAGLIFAVVGFFLSILAIALAIVVPVQRLEPPVEHASPRAVKLLSNKRSSNSSASPSSMPSTPRSTDRDNHPKVSMAFHVRLESSPFRQGRLVHAEESPSKSRPTENSLLQDNSTSPPTSCEISCASENCQGFRLRRLKPTWGGKLLDSHLIMQRSLSSPFLTSAVDPPSLIKREPSSVLVTKKSSKNLHRISSVSSGLGLKSRRLEKKKLPPLRTQPYEAPYFFPSPMLVGKTSSGSKFHTLPTAIDFARTVR